MTAADCPASTNPCEIADCVAGTCTTITAPSGSSIPAELQTSGDCKTIVCGEGGTTMANAAPEDTPEDDRNPCTSEVCDGTTPAFPPREAGTPCHNESVCNTNGACIECTPGHGHCEGHVPIRCNDDGLWEAGEVCTFRCEGSGVCAGTCRPDARTCDRDQPMVCNAAGEWQADGAVCDIACRDGACANTCTPDDIRCAGDMPQRCNSMGAWADASPCDEGLWCQDGICGTCPEPVIRIAEGTEVVSGTTLHLSASDSVLADHPITRWEWSVVQPSGVRSILASSGTAEHVTFDVHALGTYEFALKLWDSENRASCYEANYSVVVTSDAAIHIEVLWDTPTDGDQTDTGFDFFGNSVGSDVDLHLLHPDANDTWFDNIFDCYWLNRSPDWGILDQENNPSLIRDDTDGAGPEIIVLRTPEIGKTYRVGVHYWDAWGFGSSFVTVKVYISGELRLEWSAVLLDMNALWDVATIEWPSQAVARVTTESGEPVITPNFSNGFFPP
jgi:hypothetical protein